MNALPLDGRRVLIVEDEFLLADDLSEALADLGATVLGPAPTVAEALALLSAGAEIDGALLDVNLGGEKVFPVADALEAQGIRFVFTTGYEAASIPSRYQHVARFEKPANMNALVRAIGREIGA